MTKWEYKTVNYTKRSFWSSGVNTRELNEELNRLGNEGWELVSMVRCVSAGLILVLKRSRSHY